MKHRQVISTAYFQSTDFVIAIVQATHLSRFEHATAFTSAYSFITAKAGKVKYTVRMLVGFTVQRRTTFTFWGSYSETANFMKSRMSFAIVRATHLGIRG